MHLLKIKPSEDKFANINRLLANISTAAILAFLWHVQARAQVPNATRPYQVICPQSKPPQAKAFPAHDRRVWPNLSKLSKTLASLPTPCRATKIDHRNELPKSFQFYTSFCHVHAFAELWNSSVPDVFHVNAAALSLQIWILSQGIEMEEILNAEVKKIRTLLERFPPSALAHDSSRKNLQSIIQGGWAEVDFLLLSQHGFYPASLNADVKDLSVQRLTDQYNSANELIFLRARRGISDEQIKEKLRPIYQSIMDLAWRSRDQAKEWQTLEPMRDFMRKFKLESVNYEDNPDSRKALLEILKERPISISRKRHALVLAGYDPLESKVWVRNSSLVKAYYAYDADEFFTKVNGYQYLIREEN